MACEYCNGTNNVHGRDGEYLGVCPNRECIAPRSPSCSIAATMKSNNPKMEPFRSGGFINRNYDMGRVYIDLPIIEAKKLMAKLNTT